MLIIYQCSNCDSRRFFSSVQTEDVFCKNCNSKMDTPKNNVSSEIKTSEEARYLGDEALYNTVGSRITDKKSRHLTSIN